MKKLILTLTVLLISLGASTTAYAGSINSYEQDVLNAAGQTYVYNGIEYKVAPTYISQLQEYLMNDGVDLTAEQRNKVLTAVNGYIEKGVNEGYLVPVNGQSGQKDTDTSNSSDTGNSAVVTPGSDGSDTGNSAAVTPSSDSSGTDSSAVDDSGSDIIKAIDNIGNSNGSTSGTAQKKNKETSNESIDEFLQELSKGNAGSTASGQVTDDNSINISFGEDSTAVIKNTGFNLNLTFAVAVLMGVIMSAGIIVTVRYHYFAQSDE